MNAAARGEQDKREDEADSLGKDDENEMGERKWSGAPGMLLSFDFASKKLLK